MELKACPSCGSAAGTHVTVCAFCGDAFPAGAEATVIAPAGPEAPAVPIHPEPTPVTSWASDASEAQPVGAPGAWVKPDPSAPYPPASAGGPTTPHAGPEFVAGGRTAPVQPPRRSIWWVGLLAAGIAIAALVLVVRVDRGPNITEAERAALAGEGEWQTFRDPEGAFTIDLPDTPGVAPVDEGDRVRSHAVQATVGRARFRINYWDFRTGATAGVYGEDLLAGMPGLLAERTGGTHNVPIRTTAGGLPAISFTVTAGDELWSATAVLTGRRVFEFTAVGPAPAVGGHDRMIASFVPIDPNE